MRIKNQQLFGADGKKGLYLRMKLKVYYCDGNDYSSECFESEIRHRVITKPDGEIVEVDYSFNTAVIGFSKGKFNVFLKDVSMDEKDNNSKYFVNLSFWEKQRLMWIYEKHFFQNVENIKWIASGIIGYIGGLLTAWLIHKINIG